MFLTMELIDGEAWRAAEARRPLPGRARHRDRPSDLRRPRRGARLRCAAPRSQAGQHHARRGRPRPRHRLRLAGLAGSFTDIRSGGTLRPTWRRSSRRPGGQRPSDIFSPSASCCSEDLHGQARLRGVDDRRAAAHARRGRAAVARVRGPRSDPAVERVIQRCLTADPAARPQSALSVSAALPAAIRWLPRSPPARRRHRRWSRPPAAGRRCRNRLWPVAPGLRDRVSAASSPCARPPRSSA